MRIARLGLGWVALLAAGCGEGPAPSAQGPAQAVLDDFHEAVWARLGPRLPEEGEINAFDQDISELADRHLLSHRDRLAEQAAWALARLPAGPAPDRSQWEPANPQATAREQIDRLRAEFSTVRAASRPVGLAMVATRLWNPLAAASTYRTMLLTRATDMRQFARRAYLEAAAPPIVTAIDARLDSPVLAYRTGPEVVVVSLQRGADGAYELRGIEWLKRKAP